MLWDNEVPGESPCYAGKGRGTTIHRYLGAQIHPEDRPPTEDQNKWNLKLWLAGEGEGRWLVTMSSPKRQAAAWSNLILIQLPTSQTHLRHNLHTSLLLQKLYLAENVLHAIH
jgi:hypothetical protein